MRVSLVRASVAFGLVACGGAVWFAVHYVVQARNQGTAATVAQALAAVLVPVAGLAVWLVRRFQPGGPAIDLAQAADDLAARVRRQWAEAALQRGLSHHRLAVRWAWSPRGLSGSPRAATSDQRIAPLPDVPPASPRQLKAGDLSHLFAIYAGLGSGRMVLAGAPGAGKSGAMIRLLLDAADHRAGIKDPAVRAKVPVPLLLTAYDWLPERESLNDWIVRRLEGEHPFLRARARAEAGAGVVSAARALLDTGAISVLVDGVDEMPEEARTTVLRQIGRQATFRVVLSSRTSELESAVGGGHLDGAAALELAAITAQEAADYLKRRTVDPAPDPWRQLFRHLRENGTSPVARALDTPLMLSLLLDTYRPKDPVNELIDAERFPNRQQIEDHLLGRVLSAAYTSRPGSPAPSCTPQQAWQWLGYLAAQMNQDGTRDLAWWRIPQWQPSSQLRISIGRAAGLMNGLVAGLAFGIATGFVFGPTTGLKVGLTLGVTSGLGSALAVGVAVRFATGYLAALATGLAFGAEIGLATGIISGLRFGMRFGLANGVTIGLSAALVILITIGLTARFTSGPDTTTEGRFPPQYRRPRGKRRLPSAASRACSSWGSRPGLRPGSQPGCLPNSWSGSRSGSESGSQALSRVVSGAGWRAR